MNEEKKTTCMCGEGDYVVMACSGAADLGALSDAVARRLQQNGVRKMNCLAMAGANMDPFIEKLKGKNILIIDGCGTACAKRILEQHRVSHHHMVLTELGLKKGATPPTEENILSVYEKAEIIY